MFRRFLRMTSADEAAALLGRRLRPPRPVVVEHVPAEQAQGRILGAPVFARCSSPAYHGAAMDGFAVVSSATTGASPARPCRLRTSADPVAVGGAEQGADAPAAVPIDTGDPLPPGFDAVVRIEDVRGIGT